MKNKVMLDIDGCIANFYNGFATFLNQQYGCTLNPLTDPASYPFEDWGHGVDQIDFDAASESWIKQDGFDKLPCYVGAAEFIKTLMDRYDVYIVTARVDDWEQKFSKVIQNKIKKNTFDWLSRLGVPNTKLYFIKDKIPFCQEKGISVIIEDKLETALKAAKEGVHAVLMNRGYNQSKANRFRVYRVFNFDEALTQLARLIK